MSDLDNYTFSIRALNCLRGAKIHSMQELQYFVSEHGVSGLLKYSHIGGKTVQEVAEVLRELESRRKCCAGCEMFAGGEIRHHRDCTFYPDSFSEMFDNAENKIERLLAGYEQIANFTWPTTVNEAFETVEKLKDYARVIFETECQK